jgi:hypothetical protein
VKLPARAGLNTLDRKDIENLVSLLWEGPIRNSAPRVVLRSEGHLELPNRHGDGGEHCKLEKLRF